MMRRSSPRAPPGPCRSESLRFQPHISKGARDKTAQHRQRRALRSLLHRMGTHQGPQWDTPRVYPKPGHFTACAQFNPPRYSQKIDRVGPNSTSARTNARAERPPAAAHTPAFWAHVISTAATRGCIRLSLRSTHPAGRRRRPSAPTIHPGAAQATHGCCNLSSTNTRLPPFLDEHVDPAYPRSQLLLPRADATPHTRHPLDHAAVLAHAHEPKLSMWVADIRLDVRDNKTRVTPADASIGVLHAGY